MSEQQTLSGSCLCGALSYSVTGNPSRFFHCHCSRCRKASGAAHSSNLFVKGGPVAWEGDESLISHFKLPEAERFSRSFCSRCGSPLPMNISAMNMVFIPAGSLKDEPNLVPQARIFHGSRAAWSCSAEPLPVFEGYPS